MTGLMRWLEAIGMTGVTEQGSVLLGYALVCLALVIYGLAKGVWH